MRFSDEVTMGNHQNGSPHLICCDSLDLIIRLMRVEDIKKLSIFDYPCLR